jgi:mycothiol system anti-sigma-R factor
MTPLNNPFILSDGRKPTCIEMLQLILDGEANEEQRSYFKVHMDKCIPCFKSYNVDMTIKELLKSKCCNDPVPSGLVDQIKMKISQNSNS